MTPIYFGPLIFFTDSESPCPRLSESVKNIRGTKVKLTLNFYLKKCKAKR